MINRDFCNLLEYRILTALRNSPNVEVRSYWCDGILPPLLESEYSKKHVNDKRQISLSAFLGPNGQDKYSLTLLLGPKALSKYARGLDITDCIPDFEGSGCFEIDILKKEVAIHLL